MKLKQLAFALVAILALSPLLVSCDETGEKTVSSVEIVETDLVTDYYVGDEFDYTAVKLSVKYSDGTTAQLKLTDEGVKYNTLDMNTAGTQTLTVTYEGKSDSVEITISEQQPISEVKVIYFGLPTSYTDAVAIKDEDLGESGLAGADKDSFLKSIGTYKVGDDNGFVFLPEATDSNFTDIRNLQTTFALSVLNGEEYELLEGDAVAQYLTVKENLANVYFFSEQAVGKTFKLAVSVSELYDLSLLDEADKTIEATLQIVDGYNVYDQIGLSVFDNLNYNNWHDLKTAAGTLAWDTKPLVEYNVLKAGDVSGLVNQLVLHADIEIDPDQLPDNYFWDKNIEGTRENYGYEAAFNKLNSGATQEKGYPEMLNGSLRDFDPTTNWHNFNTVSNGEYAEIYPADAVNMQKGIYNSTGTGITGNGKSLTYKTEGENHKLYSVINGSVTESTINPVGHWAMFKYVDENVVERAYAGTKELFNKDPVIENLRMKGNMKRLASADGVPPELMAFNTCTDSITLNNTIISQFYTGIIGDTHDGTFSDVNAKDTKMFDFFSNMFYLWRATVKVENSIMKEAGGPVFILCDGNRTGSADDATGPHLVVDNLSVLESYAAGTEPWYQINKATALFTYFKTADSAAQAQNPQAGAMLTIARTLGRDYIHKDENGIELINMIAAIICEPGDLMANVATDPYYVSGTVQRGANEAYAMNPNFGEAFAAQVTMLQASAAPIFYSGQLMAAFTNGALDHQFVGTVSTGLGFDNDVVTTWNMVPVNDLMMMTMRAQASTPRFGVLVGGVQKYTPAQA